MRTRHITAALAGLLLATLTACSNGTDPSPAAPSTTAAPSATGSADAEAAAQACTDAVYAALQNSKAGATSLPKPPECASMNEAEYAQTVLAVLKVNNQDGQDALRKAIEDAAASAATPSP